VSCGAVFSNTCGASVPFDTRAPALSCTRDRARFSTRFRFESDRQKSVTVLSLGIGDLLEGARGTFIATLVERQSRYVLLVRLPSKDTHTVTRAIARRIRRLPLGLIKSLTWDRGGELAAHRAFTVRLM
jgi:IS30 family transposase